MAKGDQIKTLIDIGNGNVVERIYTAELAGQTVDYDVDRKTGNYEVHIVGMTGKTARTINLRGDRVIIIEEVPK